MLTREEHTRFFNTEIHTQIVEWNTYVRKRMDLLVKERELFIGRVWSLDDKRGLVIIRFKRNEVPRLNWSYYLELPGAGAEGSPSDWKFTYKEFLDASKEFGTGKASEGTFVRFQSSDSKWSFLEINLSRPEFFDFLKLMLDQQKQPLVVVAETAPPLEYLYNLRKYVENRDSDFFRLTPVPANWSPKDVDNELDQTDYFVKILEDNDLTLLQGPPGTGKSYLAAVICDNYIERKQAVVVCALTNKALMEIATQAGLRRVLEEGRIYKSNVSKAEQKAMPRLQPLTDALPAQGDLLLMTYYALSENYKLMISESRRFDLLIIEEASQAFLATFAMFREMAEKVLIIGDQMQLPPVVQTPMKSLQAIHPSVHTVINGLETLSQSLPSELTYRLVKTRRLTDDAARLTGVFYENQLRSISDLNGAVRHPDAVSDLFHPDGGTSLVELELIGDHSMKEDQAQMQIARIVQHLSAQSDELDIAVLVPTVQLEKAMSTLIGSLTEHSSRITVSTIHRVQGITVHYTIYYMPLTNPNFELDANMFNVATSRAKRGTLIVTRSTLMLNQMSPLVSGYLQGCLNVTGDFIRYNS